MTNLTFFIDCWFKEMKRTLVAIKALPTEIQQLQYRPNEKSRSAIEILGHILPHAEDLLNAVDTKVIAEKYKEFDNIDSAYHYYQTQSQFLIDKLKSVDEYTWENCPIILTVNDIKLYEGKMMNLFWDLLFDTIHHRGQLTTYYRAMGVRNPSIYGPPAEDTEAFMAAAISKNNSAADK